MPTGHAPVRRDPERLPKRCRSRPADVYCSWCQAPKLHSPSPSCRCAAARAWRRPCPSLSKNTSPRTSTRCTSRSAAARIPPWARRSPRLRAGSWIAGALPVARRVSRRRRPTLTRLSCRRCRPAAHSCSMRARCMCAEPKRCPSYSTPSPWPPRSTSRSARRRTKARRASMSRSSFRPANTKPTVILSRDCAHAPRACRSS
jgi:hypothetical protein